jgi:hypothetical protein
MLDEAARQQERSREASQREAERQARKADYEARRAQKEQEKQVAADQARSVREAAAAGAKIETDVATGKRAVATHSDGAVKFETGPVGEPFVQQTAEAAMSSIPGMGGFMSLTRPANQQSLGQTQEVAQTYRDDRGGQVTAALPTKTDPKTGAITSTVQDPVTGRPTAVTLGTDQAIQAKAAKDAELEQRRQEIALRKNRVDQDKMRFTPQWEPVKREFDEAGEALNAFTDPEKIKFIRDPKTGKMAKRDPNTGLPSREYVDPNELAKWTQDKTALEARHERAKAAHDKLSPFAENLNRNETEIEEARLKYVEEKIRHDSGIKEDAPLSSFTTEGKAKALEELSTAKPTTVKLKQQDGSEADVPMLPLKTQDGQSIHIPMVDEAGKKLTKEQALDQYDKKGTHVKLETDQDDSDTVSPFTRKLVNMDIEAARVRSAMSTGKVNPVAGEKRFQLLAELKNQTIEQAKAEATARLEAQGREIAAKFIGTGVKSQQLAGAKSGGYAEFKNELNEMGAWITGNENIREKTAQRFRLSGHNLDRAITMAEGDTKKSLTAMKEQFDKAGINPEERARIIKDAAMAQAWTEKDADNLRQLSTGDLVINPGRVFGQKDALIAEINASDTNPAAKKDAIARLDAMRKAMAETLENDTYYADSGFAEFVQAKAEKGESDKVAMLDEWMAQQKNRNGIFKAVDAVKVGLQTGTIGIAKTAVGGAAGISALVGADGMAGSLGENAQFLGEASNQIGAAGKTRGLTGGYGITTDLTNTVTQMAPMLVGGWAAGGLKGASQVATRGASVYGWAAAQGYESKLSDALDMAAAKKGSALTSDEIAGVLGQTDTQVAGFLNAAQTVILAAAFPKGAEAGALGKVSASMTVSDFLRRGGMRAVKDGTLRQEIKTIGKNIFADGKDEALEEFSNQVLDGMISVAALDKELQLGTLLEDSFKALALGGGVGGVMPQVYAGQTKQQQHEQLAATLQNQMLGQPDRSMVSTALATLDPQTKAPTEAEIKQARQIVQPSVAALKEIEERRAAYKAAIKAKDYKGAAAIDQEINDKFTQAQTDAALAAADAVLLTRELAGIEEQAKEAVGQANAALYQAKATGDKQGIAAAEANLEQVTKDAPNVPLARAAVKLATGQDISALTDSELRAVGYKPGESGAPVQMTTSELKAQGLAKPLVRMDTADGSAVILDEAIDQVIQTSTLAALRIQLGEQAAMEAAQARYDSAQQATTPPTNEQDPQGTPGQEVTPENPQPAPADANAPLPAGGNGTPAPVSGGTGATSAQASVNLAEMEAGKYEAARSINPNMPDAASTVKVAINRNQPVSVSMAKAAGVNPEGYTRQGALMVPSVRDATSTQNQGDAMRNPNDSDSRDATSGEKDVRVMRNPEKSGSRDALPAQPEPQSAAQSAIDRAKARFPGLTGGFQIVEGGDGTTGGAQASGATITILTGDLERELSGYAPEKQDSRVDAVIDEEVIHLAQFEAARRSGESVEDFYGALWGEFTPAQRKAAASTYQATFDKQEDWQKAAETVRILIQQRADGRVTELTKAFNKNIPARLVEILKAAVEFLKSSIENGEISQRVQDAITGIEAILAEYSTDKTTDKKQAATPVNQATARETQDKTTDTATTEESFAVDPAQDLRDATETIRQAVVAALASNPALEGTDLGFDLEDIAFDMAEALATVPADQRKGMVDAAIAAWLEDNIAEKPAKATGTADQKARRKAWRQAAQEKLNAAARAILNSGVHEAFSAVFDKGRITPMPNILGLIRKRRADGKTLTQREIDIWQNESEWNGALKKSNYTGGGQNPLARAMIDLIMARQGEGQSPNTMADALKRVGTGKLKDMDSASDMWEQLAKELRAVTSGKSEDKAGYNPMDDPNYEPTDAEIAEWEAKQAATAQDQDQQPYVTLGDAYGYAIEAFGPDAPITQKIGTISEHADRFYRDDMPSVRAVISAEFARHANGQAIVEAPKPEFEGPAAAFYRFFITTPAEKMREMLASLPVADVDSALFSSPSPGNIRLDLISSFSKPPASYTYETSNERRESILSIARKHGLRLVNPADQGTAIRRFQEVYGVTVTFYEGGSPKNTGFVSGNNIFVNSERNDIPTSWTLTHELIHVGQKDLTAGTPEISGLIGSLLSDTELKAVEDRLLSEGYKRHELATEIPAFLIADAVTDGEVFGFDSFARGAELKASLVDWFDSLQSLNPELLKTATDDELTRLNSSPTQPGFSFDQTTDAGDASQKGFNFGTLPPGPNAKFVENTQKAYDHATTDKARENIAKDSAAREGMKNRGKVQNVPQGMMDFGMSGSFGTKDQPSLFDAGPNGRPSIQTTDGGTLEAPGQISLFSSPAWHGTPHKVDKFRLAKIGTGEGALAFGWGLYFAGLKKVAEDYQKKLADGSLLTRDGQIFDDRKELKNMNVRSVLNRNDGDIDAAIARAKQVIESIPETQGAEYAANDIQRLERLKEEGGLRKSTGYLYTVTLDVNDEDLLDWDKPLSEQSEKVQAAIKSQMPQRSWEIMKSRSGQEYYERYWNAKSAAMEGDIRSASLAINSLGIPGIRYLDGNSRADGQGSYNYVIFDESLIKITEENGKPVETAALFSSPSNQRSLDFGFSGSLGTRDQEGFDFSAKPVTGPAKMPRRLPDTAFTRTIDRMGPDRGELRKFDKEAYEAKYDRISKEEQAKDAANDAKIDAWLATIPENKPISFEVGNPAEDFSGFNVVTKNASDPARPWRATWWRRYPRPEWTDAQEEEYEALFKKTRTGMMGVSDEEYRAVHARLNELADIQRLPGKTRMIPTGHQEFKTRREALDDAVSMTEGNPEPIIGALFSSPTRGQGSFDFGTTGSFNTRNQPGFDFGTPQQPTPQDTAKPAESPQAETPSQSTRPRSAVQNLWDWASDASASIDPRAPQGNLFDTTPKTTDTQSNDIPSSTNLEPDRQKSNTGNGGRQGGVSTRRGSTRQAGRSLDEGGSRSGDAGQGGAMPAGVPSATDGITGDPSVSPTEPAAQGGDSRDSGRSGRRGPDDGGLSPQRPGANEPRINLVLTPESTGPLAPSSPRSAQGSVTGEWKSPLTPEQQGDVEFIDARLNQNGHPGVLLTNGTGTGKTFSGLGAIKQALDRGAMHILVVAPSDKVGSDWKNTAQEFFNIQDAAQLVDTKDNGGTNRLVMTTYANLGQNANLVNRPWDLIVADEAHYLSQNKEGKDTNALDTLRALTFHKNGIFRRAEMLEPEAAEISKQIRKLPFRERMSPIRTAQMEQADRALSAARERIKSQMPAREARPKAILLSATPFAWHFSLDYAEGYLFDHGPEPTSRAYNTPSARDRFYIENFGYRMRTGKLTQPDAAAATATGILERRFAEKLMKEKAMSGRALQVEQDYSRQFILSETKLGEQIDAIIKAIRENPRFTVLSDYIGLGDYLARRYLLEGMKARESVDRIRKHLAMGRKVVVFHDYKKGGAVNPLRAVFHKGDVIEQRNQETGEMETINLPMRLAELKRAIPGYAATERELDGLLSPIDRIEREFPQARIFNGSVPKGQRRAIVDEFNRSGSSVNVILVQRASGKEGISLHDRDAKHQRVFIDIGLANRPTDAIQGEGRIYRHGVRSNAIVEYLSTGTDFERQTFAETIAKRSSTAENLAMGERARSLLQSFANGYNEAEAIDPNDNQGTGGKEMDRQIEEGSSYKTAVALFYTNQKKTSRNKSSEGSDYFATPEPLGFKMVEWADIQPGEKVLEPSAGHGAIARFFPDSTNRHGIEPSSELASRLALNATDITIHRQRFEDYNVMNKFNAVVMNPPFGTAGKTAMDHLIKALGHLRNGGRVVALIPEGSSMEKRFDKWYESDEAKNYYVRAEIKLPTSTFERAGTGVSTRVVIIDKMVARKGDEQKNLENTRIDLTRHETLQEFINELEFITVPPRPEVAPVAAEEAEAEQAANLVTGGRDFILPSTIPQPEAETTFSTAEFNHSKTGAPLFVAKIERRLSKDEYARVAASAKAFGGYYSSYNKEGAIPGFHFKSAEARDVFIGGASGESPLGSSPTALFSSPTPVTSEQLGTVLLDKIGEEALRVEQPKAKYEDKRQQLFDFAQSIIEGDPESGQDTGNDAASGDVAGERMLLGRLGDASIIRQRLARDIQTDLQVRFIGDTIGSPEDLAVKAQALRNPRFETFYVLAAKHRTARAKNGAGYQILDAMAITSRVPTSAAVFVDGKNMEDGMKDHLDFLQRVNATHYFLLHNHPSGDPSPSSADLRMTMLHAKEMEKQGIKLVDHIVINHEPFASIDAYGVINSNSIPASSLREVGTEYDPYRWPSKFIDGVKDIGMDGNSPDQIASIARDIEADRANPDHVLGFIVNARGRIVATFTGTQDQVFTIGKDALVDYTRDQGGARLMLHAKAADRLAAERMINSFHGLNVRNLLTDIVVDFKTASGQTHYISGVESGLFVPPPQFYGEENKSAGMRVQEGNQPDLFAAATAPDATQRLGTVKVGTKNALGAYRALTAKRDAGKALTGEEEQTLLDAEQALGQKLAFDMDALRSTAPVTETPAPTAPAAVFGQNRQAGQDEMSRAGEIDRSGQISLLSSPTPAQDADYLAAVESGDMETAQRMVDEAAKKAGYNMSHRQRSPDVKKTGDVLLFVDDTTSNTSYGSHDFVVKGLSEIPDYVKTFAFDYYGDEGQTEPEDILESAQAWDDRQFVSDLWQKYGDTFLDEGIVGFKTPDGAVVFDRATALANGQIKSADPVTRDADGNVIPLSQRFNPAKDSILFSSPTPETIDWKKFPPVFKLVYAAILEGQSVAQIAKKLRITEKAVTNISTQLSTRVQALDEAADGKLVPKMNDGLLERGRPERAMSVSSPEVARILQIRQDNGDPEVIANAETYANAKRMIAADYQGTIERITNRRANGEDLTLDEVAAAQMILLGKVGKKRSQMTPEEKVQLGWLAMDWVEQGTEDARRLQIRRDVTHSPAERAALYFAKELYTPQDKATVEALKKAKGRKAKEEVMKRFMERSEGLKSRLKERGIDLEASLEEFRRQQDEKQAMEESVKQAHDRLTNGYQDEVSSLQDQLAKANEATAAAQAMGLASKEQIAKMEADAAAMAEKLKKARADLSKARMLEPGLVLRTALLNLTDAQKAAMETLLNGGTIENALAVGGMTQEALKKLYINFGNVLKKARLEAQALAKQRMLEMPPVLMSSSMESDELRMVGYVPWGELEERKAPITPEQVKVKPKKQPKAKPAEPVTLTPEQQEAIDAAFERFKNADPATWTTLFETESKTLAPLIGQVGFEEFKGRLLQPWKDRWQTEMDGIANPAARITFEEWIAKPSTKETANRERDLFPQPINETTGTFDTTAPNREGSLFPAPINETTGTWNDTRPYTSQGELIREEISTTTGLLDFNDPLSVRNALREISTGRSSTMDRIMEFWRASILSGPQTAIVNTMSNFAFGGFNMGPRRVVEAGVNSMLNLAGIKSNESADFGELVVMAKHLRGAAKLAGLKMLQSWREESANFKAYALASENQLNFGGKDWESFEPALPGKLGTFMRAISFRHMQAADEFMKFFFGQVEAAAQAHRIAKSEGLKGKDYQARLDDLIERKGSEAWQKTFDIMQRNTFQEEMVPLGENTAAIRIFDTIAMKAKSARRMPYIGRPITFFLPFINTPTNIAKQAVEMSPLGGMLALIDGSRALKRRLSAGKLNADGMRISKEEAKMMADELYDKERFVKDMTNQVIAWGLYFAISAMVDGDDDDELPLITGTMAYTITKRGERDVAERVMPPQSIRIPGTNTFMSYSRMDPFATIMAGMVDMTRSLNREGGMNSKVATDFLVHTKNAMKDKTFLQGVSNMINALEDPSRVMERLSAGILTGFVPNLIRQPIRESDMMKRDVSPRESDGLAMSIAKRIGYSIVPASAPLKIDVWGRELPANHGEMIGGHPVANAIFRTLDPTNLTVGAKIDPLDLYIFTWNNEAQDTDKISITPIEDFVTGTVNGKSTKFPLTVAEQTEANRRVGRQAYEFLMAQGLDHRSTSKQGAELITDAFRSMQRTERERIRNEKINAGQPPLK